MLYRPTAESQVMLMNNDCRVDDVCSEEMNGDVSERRSRCSLQQGGSASGVLP